MYNRENAVIELVTKYLGKYKRVGNGELRVQYCPFCDGGEHHDKDTFCITLDTGAYMCQRASCGASGSFKQLCDFLGEALPRDFYDPRTVGKKKKVFDKPDASKYGMLTDQIVKYFNSRCISKQTLLDFKIQSDANGNIVFPFYRNNVLTYVKYRKPMKPQKTDNSPKEWCEANTEPILFGMDNVSLNDTMYITEGEIDALSLYEAGIRNVVSVPSGCKNMDWIDLCWNWLEQFQNIALFGDNDKPGQEMVTTLMNRLGEGRCMLPPDYPELIVNGKDYGRECKDANEILFAYGPEYLHDLAKQCEPTPISGLINVASIPYVDPTSVVRIETGIPDLDDATGGFAEGSLVVLSGKPSEGKSTLSGNILNYAIEQGFKGAAYSAELTQQQFFNWIISSACDAKYMTIHKSERTNKEYPVVPMEVQDRIRQWIDGKLYLFDSAYADMHKSSFDSMINAFTFCAKRYGCRIFLVD